MLVTQPAVHLTREGVSLVLAPSPSVVPTILHWGPALGDSEGWYVVATVDSVTTQSPTSVVLPGLDPTRSYRVTGETPPGQHQVDLGHSWLDDDDGVTVPGSVLTSLGVRLPVMAPESAHVLRVSALPRG